MMVRSTLLATLASAVLATSAQAAFVAYNDCQTYNGGNPANTTRYGYNDNNETGTGNTAINNGQLKDFVTGSTVGATVAVVNNGGVTSGTGGAAEFAPGTDAANIFGGKVINAGRTLYYGAAAGWSFDLVFTNLTPGAKYIVATTLDRGTNYANRWTVISLQNTISSTYASSPAALQVSALATSIQSNNEANGYVAKWTDIDPGSDNAFTVHFTYPTAANEYGAPGQDGIKGYGPAMFMLQEVDVPEPASLSLLGMGAFLLFRRK